VKKEKEKEKEHQYIVQQHLSLPKVRNATPLTEKVT
jgi:hypothetical protein